ncbi:hypothetical protein LX15_005267 [Streptoalloteichus tenebrarius]|uniref:Secreted protein n=1 Tax=Streptoalloteichus tenebrarius (strain ATCC 17920 / DSM 40477 / JCM 4838 / CBS 697.72 / NBRC 16177 / NCIMB 11028 / NRRL B-12390 / A12253. 1 / ISP 5477) TaxID=1933 RepID=A0ABT1I1D1_STRSD|nr:bacteriophage spanin2 family protein [Streptoalloteichus tenebrarius]MCP2261541.1 hypothetical protein [Streptoalloteichus tenebrarius]BFF02684.1 hypothetical protein GCM10020241_43590 [Streptoalloteichus tenebrarius]
MRFAGSRPVPMLATAVAGPLLALALSGCGALDSASNAVDKAQLCTQAISAVTGFNPSLSDPRRSVDEAQQKADELRQLADKAADANLQRELREMADSLAQLRVTDVNPQNMAAWADQKVKQLDDLRRSCS